MVDKSKTVTFVLEALLKQSMERSLRIYLLNEAEF